MPTLIDSQIFSPKEPIPFNEIRDSYAFMNLLSDMYRELESSNNLDESVRQVWHTPTELFRVKHPLLYMLSFYIYITFFFLQPWYGYSVGNYILQEFKRDRRDAKTLDIFEVGGGNGTLMLNILDYIRKEDPDIYAITHYTIIEISPSLASIQRIKKQSGHKNASVVNKSIFNWDKVIPEACFFIAMEVVVCTSKKGFIFNL